MREQSQSLTCAGVELGLVSSPFRKLTEGLRPALGFGPDHGDADVKRRHEKILRVSLGREP